VATSDIIRAACDFGNGSTQTGLKIRRQDYLKQEILDSAVTVPGWIEDDYTGEILLVRLSTTFS
jgi:hypothetical protein